MKIVLAGQKSFGAATLATLLNAGQKVCLVVSRPGDALWNNAKYDTGVDLADRLDADQIREYDADLILCAHSHSFVGRKSRAATKLGALVGHPSLLPRHRGKDAVEWTIRMGDPVAGFSWFWADANVDTGPVFAQDWCHVVPGWTASDLWREELFAMGQRLLARTVLPALERGQVWAFRQDPRVATTEPSIDRSRLHRPELPELGSGPAGFEYVAHRRDPRIDDSRSSRTPPV